jgi:hypothetical protein
MISVTQRSGRRVGFNRPEQHRRISKAGGLRPACAQARPVPWLRTSGNGLTIGLVAESR